MNTHDRGHPTKEEIRELGREIAKMLEPLKQKHPELEFVIAYTLPRELNREKLAIGVASNVDSPTRIVRILLGAAREIHEQLVLPFTSKHHDC